MSGDGMGMGALTKCGKNCGQKGPARHTILVDRVDSTRYANGSQVTVRLKGLQPKDAQGRIAHVVGFEIRGDYSITSATTTSDAVSAHTQLGILKSFFLTGAGGWSYLNGNIDGRDLVDDVYTRNLRYPAAVALPALQAINAGIATYQKDLHLYFPFTRQDGANASMRGAIPLAALQSRTDALRFTVATALPGNPTDVAFDGFSGTLRIWLHVVYLPGVWIDPGWQLESYTKTDQSSMVRHDDRRHEYVAIRPHLEDSATLSGYDGVTLEAGGNLVISALSTAEMVERNDTITDTELDAEVPLFSYSYEGATDAPGGYMLLGRTKSVKAAAAGAVSYNFASRSDSSTRFLHRSMPCHGGSVGKPTLRAVAGCAPSQARGYQYDEVTKQALPAGTVDNEAPIVVTNFTRMV